MDNELRRGQTPPASMINEMMDLAEASIEISGYGVNKYEGGTQVLPPDIEEIWIIVTGQGSSSSSDVSAGTTSSPVLNSAPGSGTSDPGTSLTTPLTGSTSSGADPALTDNYYTWNQTMVLTDANGKEQHVIDPSGLNGTQTSNPAIEVNSRNDVPEGYITKAYLSPSRNAWHFNYPGFSGTSSGPLKMVVDCAAGTIVVGTPSSSSSTNSSIDPNVDPNKAPGGGPNQVPRDRDFGQVDP